MYGLLLTGILLLAAIVSWLLFTAFPATETVQPEALHPFAILPVPDGTASTRAFLQHYASQVAWMDAAVLRCVLLVYPPEDAEICALCTEMAQEYEVYTAMSLPEVHTLLEARSGRNDTISDL